MRNLLSMLFAGIILGFIIQEIAYKIYMKPSIGCIESIKREKGQHHDTK